MCNYTAFSVNEKIDTAVKSVWGKYEATTSNQPTKGETALSKKLTKSVNL